MFGKRIPEAGSLQHSCKHTSRVRQAMLTSAREQRTAAQLSAPAQHSVVLEMFPDALAMQFLLKTQQGEESPGYRL